ncbi:MAG: hypothetical protein ACRC8O_00980 [Plesiomonas shigelloides]
MLMEELHFLVLVIHGPEATKRFTSALKGLQLAESSLGNEERHRAALVIMKEFDFECKTILKLVRKRNELSPSLLHMTNFDLFKLLLGQ